MNQGNQLSIDEVFAIITQIARDPDAGADRLRALKILTAQDAAANVLPAPLTTEERIKRLVRVMRGAGRILCQQAWRQAWPTSRAKINDLETQFKFTPTEEEKIVLRHIVSLKSLYRHFPEMKQHGVPSGFPTSHGRGIQRSWCHRQALKMLRDRRIKAINQEQQADEPDGTLAADEIGAS